jgi:2-polyprenyl-6-hydroxyphenyl methylase/3-demethylubiquinone-9 3-methyltransferase
MQEPEPTDTDPITFSFGENWMSFVETHLSQERVDMAKQHLLNFLHVPDLKGKYFLDAGSGSGIHSLAAIQAGAERVVSFDVDDVAVATTNRVRTHFGSPPHWEVRHGSVLDVEFLRTLEPADVVYSWGVLHHTGHMWQAIRNVATLIKEDGQFYVALYLTTPRTPYWLKIKKRYNNASPLGKRGMELWYLVRHTALPELVRFRNPLRIILSRNRTRGMSYWIDVRDWLGGYPYEDARVEEVLRFGRTELGLELTNIKIESTLTEYLFARQRTATTPNGLATKDPTFGQTDE